MLLLIKKKYFTINLYFFIWIFCFVRETLQTLSNETIKKEKNNSIDYFREENSIEFSSLLRYQKEIKFSYKYLKSELYSLLYINKK